jgi:serine/threonine protein kinase
MGHIYLVMEYVDHDLAGLLDAKVDLTGKRVKAIVKQILDGLNYMHENRIIHRCGGLPVIWCEA